eukprot:GHVR01094337.1.p1 GENE.GHVR01094337.1~~GHVR01094337.1.p1  ORF type:complete len:298 (+),score=44.05 GHVR01094337.1:41-934(+)
MAKHIVKETMISSGQSWFLGIPILIVMSLFSMLIALSTAKWGVFKDGVNNFSFGMHKFYSEFDSSIRLITSGLSLDAKVGISRGLSNGWRGYKKIDKYALHWWFGSGSLLTVSHFFFWFGILVSLGAVVILCYLSQKFELKNLKFAFIAGAACLGACLCWIISLITHNSYISVIADNTNGQFDMSAGVSFFLHILSILLMAICAPVTVFAVNKAKCYFTKSEEAELLQDQQVSGGLSGVAGMPVYDTTLVLGVGPPGFEGPPPVDGVASHGEGPPGFQRFDAQGEIPRTGAGPPGFY